MNPSHDKKHHDFHVSCIAREIAIDDCNIDL